MTIFYAILILTVLGLLFGILIWVADKYLYVKEDTRLIDIKNILPNANCGACGYPGCEAYSKAIIEMKAPHLNLCKPGEKQQVNKKIREYLDTHPDDKGNINTLKVA